MEPKRSLTQEYLKSVIHYDPDTGVFMWIATCSNRACAGTEAGTINGSGYRQIMVAGRIYNAHRLAFLYMTGEFPPNVTDHQNGIRADNRWNNLRAVSSAENAKNIRRHKRNKSGITGVHWSKANQKWAVYIQVSGKSKNLGYFYDIKEAVAVRLAASQANGFHPNHGSTV